MKQLLIILLLLISTKITAQTDTLCKQKTDTVKSNQLTDADIIKQARQPNLFYTKTPPVQIPYKSTHRDSFWKREGKAQLSGLNEGAKGVIRTSLGTIIVGLANFIY